MALNEELPVPMIAKMDAFVSYETISRETDHSHLLQPGHAKHAVQHKALKKLRSLFSGDHLLGHSKSQNVTFDFFAKLGMLEI